MHVEYVTAFAPDCCDRGLRLVGGRYFTREKVEGERDEQKQCTRHDKRTKERNELTQRTVISRRFTRRTAPLIRDATDPTDVAFVVLIVVCVSCVPAPLSDCAPVFDVDFHGLVCVCVEYAGASEEEGLGLFGIVYASWVC